MNIIFNIEELKNIIAKAAYDYNVQKVMLFGSYFDGNPSVESDIDLLVSYGNNCKGLKRIEFMQELEKNLGKNVDVINTDFPPQFINDIDLSDERRIMYDGQRNGLSYKISRITFKSNCRIEK